MPGGVRGGVKPGDVLATIRAEIEARRDELRAAVEEYEQLLSAAAALETEAREKPPPVRAQAPVVRKVSVVRTVSVAPKGPAGRKLAVRDSTSTPVTLSVPVVPKEPLVRRMRISSKASIVRKTPGLPKAKATASSTVASPKPRPQPPLKTKAPAKTAPLVSEPAPVRAARPEQDPAPARVSRSSAQQAITAALEHGSHTLAELAIVTAMSNPTIREALRALQKAGKITKAKREGKAAYALAGR